MERLDLYLKHENLVYSFLKYKSKYRPFNRQDLEDYIQELKIRIWESTDTYKPDKCKFTTWATLQMQHYHDEFIRHINRDKRRIHQEELKSLDFQISVDDGEGISVADTIESHEDTAEQAILNMIIQSLSDEEKNVIRLFKTCKDQGEIGLILGVNQTNVSKRKFKVIEKIVGYISKSIEKYGGEK